MLRSEYLAWWRDLTRRSALPLLLTSLLLLMPSLPAPADCFCESDQPQGIAAHSDAEAHIHENSEAPSKGQKPGSLPNAASPTAQHSHLVARRQMALSRTVTACCSCSQAPLTAAIVAGPTPSKTHADSQPLVYVEAHDSGAFRFDCLTGLFGRAGPAPRSKPKLLFLASLVGRAPPVSI